MLKTRLLLFFFLAYPLQQASAYPILKADRHPENFQTIDDYFQQIRYSKELLTDFFTAFPKGGDLHNHFMGSPSPATLLQEGVTQSLCLDKDFTFISCQPGEMSALNVSQNYQLELAFKRAMTTTLDTAIPTLTRHANFFSAFAKTIEFYDRLPVPFMDNIRQRAARESLYYIESTTYWSERYGPSQLFSLLDGLPALLPLTTASMTDFMAQLTKLSAFKTQINTAAETFQKVLDDSDLSLNCNTSEPNEGCKVSVRFIHETHRTNAPEQVFAQLIFSMYLAQQSLESEHPVVLGINIVGAEDDYVARTDYGLHMDMISFLKNSGQYPLASVTLHAGEMTKEIGSFEETSESLSEAVTKVFPKRIGHGVSLAEQYCSSLAPEYKTCSEQLASLMNQHNMALEIPYVSNQVLLDTTKDTHPLPLYLKYAVPVVLATDDPGVLKTDLTSQFVEVAYLYEDITFDQFVTMTRNSLEYSMLPGKSLWQHTSTGKPDYSRRVKECAQLDSKSCNTYVANNPKGAKQVNHENNLTGFMMKFDNSDLRHRDGLEMPL